MSRIVFLFLLGCCLACSSKPPQSPLASLGAEQFGAQSAFVLFEVPPEEEKPFKLVKSSPAGRRLAELMAPASTSVVKLIVGGPSSESTKQAVLEAFSHYRGTMLGGLELVFVGEAVDAREVREAASPLLATVHFTDVRALSSP